MASIPMDMVKVPQDMIQIICGHGRCLLGHCHGSYGMVTVPDDMVNTLLVGHDISLPRYVKSTHVHAKVYMDMLNDMIHVSLYMLNVSYVMVNVPQVMVNVPMAG
jgi:hypothetical protein